MARGNSHAADAVPDGQGKRLPAAVVRSLPVLVFLTVLAWGTYSEPNFWTSAQQRGDRLMAAGDYEGASDAYTDPWHIGVAQYRNGDFEDAASSFARVPGATGAFDQGNALLMHGNYEDAIDSYDRALGFRAGWQEAIDNKALAAARKQRMDDAGKDRDEESAAAFDPDETVVDQKGEDKKSKPEDMNAAAMSDEELRSTWLRRVQTTPGDFLRAKFAYQSAHAAQTTTDEDAAAAGDTGGTQ
jgi:Ca-activated chloride channel family protein